MEDITLEWIESFAELTGSALNPLCRPMDRDYFAKYDYELIQVLSKHASDCRNDNMTHDPSVKHWTDSVCFKLKIDEVPVDLFFVGKQYYEALKAYSKLMQELCENEHWAAFLMVKSNRVQLAESFRALYAPVEED